MKSMWDSRYMMKEYAYGTVPNKYFKEKLKTMPAGKVFLICDGEGRNSVYAAYLGWRAEAMDYSEYGMEKAMKLAELKKVDLEFHVSPVETYVFPTEEYNAVGLIFAQFPPILRTYVHAQARKCLKKGGKLILEAFTKEQLERESGGPTKIEELYDLDELRNDFAGFEFHEILQTESLMNEGLYHVGMCSVIRIFATKL
jgi:hypothetical protein